MRYLLLLLAALVVAPSATAQWSYASNFPVNDEVLTPHNHGLAVDPDGRVWIQAYYPFTGDSVAVDPAIVANSSAANCNQTTNMCRVTAIYVVNADGTQADFSPLNIVTLPGGEQDTLGGGVIVNSTGVSVWDYNSGRGLRAGPDGNIYASIFDTLYKFDYETGEVLDVLEPTSLDARGLTTPGVDNSGNVYLTGVFPGDPLAIYDANLDFIGNALEADNGFNRTVLALPDGNTVFSFNYSNDVTTVVQRENEFAAWDSVGTVFEGMSVESAAIHPTTGNIWVSAGSPNDPPLAPWQPHTWYEFTPADVLDGGELAPLDSIVWNNPGDGRPRAIAFSPDGDTAYVGEFNLASPAVQVFTRQGTSAGNGPEIAGVTLRQNYPNPFRGSTEISFEMETASNVRLAVFDALGREVAVLTDGALAAGTHSARFNATGLAGGIYVVTLEVNGQSTSRRMLHMR